MINSDSIAVFEAPELASLAPLFPGYEFEGLIATGGMGAVYKAVQLSLDRPVAIKILPPEFGQDALFRANFEAEAKAMARLNHPSLIGVYDFGEVAGMLFIVMEFVLGQTLYHSAHGIAIAPETAASIVADVCIGLAHAHEHGFLHRDIKPANILLDQQARPKIGDFGLSRPIGTAVMAGEGIFGTPNYTAPEVLLHPQQVDARADIFSVGVVLHELLTGQLPANDTRPASVISGCDARFDAIIRRATNPVPELRYPSASYMAKDLLALCTSTPPAGTTKVAGRRGHSPASVRPKLARKRRFAVTSKSSGNMVTMILVVAAAVIAISYLLFPQAFNITKPATAPPAAPVAPPQQLPTQTPPAMDRTQNATPPVPNR